MTFVTGSSALRRIVSERGRDLGTPGGGVEPCEPITVIGQCGQRSMAVIRSCSSKRNPMLARTSSASYRVSDDAVRVLLKPAADGHLPPPSTRSADVSTSSTLELFAFAGVSRR
jgi:hypothetical protein